MKTIIGSKLLWLCLLLNLAYVKADQMYDDSYEVDQDCETNCESNFCFDSLDFQIQAGVAPALWVSRGYFQAVACNALSIPGFSQSIVNFFQLPKFSKLFNVPWIVGGHIGCYLSPCVEVYVEFNYRQAQGKTFSLTGTKAVTIPNDKVNVVFNFNNRFRAFDAYIGARCYWIWDECWCDEVHLFLGIKFGLVHHKQLNFMYSLTSATNTCATAVNNLTSACSPFFYATTAPAVGLNLGCEWCLGCSFWLC